MDKCQVIFSSSRTFKIEKEFLFLLFIDLTQLQTKFQKKQIFQRLLSFVFKFIYLKKYLILVHQLTKQRHPNNL